LNKGHGENIGFSDGGGRVRTVRLFADLLVTTVRVGKGKLSTREVAPISLVSPVFSIFDYSLYLLILYFSPQTRGESHGHPPRSGGTTAAKKKFTVGKGRKWTGGGTSEGRAGKKTARRIRDGTKKGGNWCRAIAAQRGKART